MSSAPAELVGVLARIGREISPIGARRMADTLRRCRRAGELSYRLDGLPVRNLRNLVEDLVREWESCDSIDGKEVALALIVAQRAAEQERNAETVELTWTGPKTPQVPLTRNDEALLNLAEGAREELLLVSYATYQVPRVVERLGKAVDRGVTVDIVLEFHGPDGEIDYDPIRGLGAELRPEIRVWYWPPEVRSKDERGRMGYIHVKCAVADGETAFVSSANLTVYAMERNMELGVVIEGGSVPRRIADHFRELIRRGTLERFWE